MDSWLKQQFDRPTNRLERRRRVKTRVKVLNKRKKAQLRKK